MTALGAAVLLRAFKSEWKGENVKRALLVVCLCLVVFGLAGTSFAQFAGYTTTSILACNQYPQAFSVKPNYKVCLYAHVTEHLYEIPGFWISYPEDDGRVCFYDQVSNSWLGCSYVNYNGVAKLCFVPSVSPSHPYMDITAFFTDLDSPDSHSAGFHLYIDPTSTSFGCS